MMCLIASSSCLGHYYRLKPLRNNRQLDDNYEGQTNVVIAKDLHTFARLALRYGCFELTELAYAPKTAIHAFTTAGASKKAIDESEQLKQKVRAFVAKDLDLPPYYYTVEEFEALQAKYMPLLQMPKEYSQ